MDLVMEKIVYLEGLFEKLSISLIDNKGIW